MTFTLTTGADFVFAIGIPTFVIITAAGAVRSAVKSGRDPKPYDWETQGF